MKKVSDKQILVGADFAGYPLKEAVCDDFKGEEKVLRSGVNNLLYENI